MSPTTAPSKFSSVYPKNKKINCTVFAYEQTGKISFLFEHFTKRKLSNVGLIALTLRFHSQNIVIRAIKSNFIYLNADPDQSIYGFRSAEPKNFKKMQNDFSGIGVINMEQNYRSTGKILKAALHVISQGKRLNRKHISQQINEINSIFRSVDSSRFDKSLRTTNPDGKPIFRISTENENSQAEFVATEIQKMIRGSMGLINYKDIAVLMRMNFLSRHFEEVFKYHKIPFTIVNLIVLLQ